MACVLADLTYARPFAPGASCLAVTSNPRPDCFRLEQQLPGGISSSHWINAPFHGALKPWAILKHAFGAPLASDHWRQVGSHFPFPN
jgi:hypothetical protein